MKIKNLRLSDSLLLLAFFYSIQIIKAQDLQNIKNEKPIDIKGSLGASAILYNVDGKTASFEPFSYLFRGNFEISAFGISAPVSFLLTDKQREFRQPLNQFGITPYYKWAKLYLGYQSLNWSKYTLAGHSISGAGLELTPGKFRLAVIHGRLLKAIEQKPDDDLNSKVQIPSFKRNGTIIKAGYGSKDNFVDLLFLRATDKLNSLDSVPTNYNVLPSENMVAGLTTHQRISDHLFFELEYAQSSYTADFRTAIKDTSGGFIVNSLSGLFSNRTTTEFGSAFESSLSYQEAKYGIKFRIKRIDPGFRSMGAYYFLNDLQNITLEPKVKLFSNKLNISASFGFQHDNLKDTKKVTTRRTISSLNISALPAKNYSVSAFYSNYGIGQKSGFSPLDTMLEVSQSTKNLGITQNYMLQKETMVHTFLMNYNYQQLTDDNVNTSSFTDFNTSNFILGYTFLLTKTGINTGINYIHTAFSNSLQKNVYNGPSISFSRSFAKNKLNLSVSESVMTVKIDDNKNNRISTFNTRLTYRIKKNQRLSARLYFHNNKALQSGSGSFKETKGELNYVYSF
ncbi:hypothetical protein [Saccharicrinis sp. FJH54]|uniref:hypothetical protein n=1 Tax=Saccharicrinis sp. FJH54 TaxID=3344665 RepID=UPI0035D4437C